MGKIINLKIIIIFILLIISSTLIYLSTSNKNISLEYTFINKSVKISDSNFKIGEINIENNGLLVSKVYLKNLVGCIDKRFINLNYINSNNDKNNIFSTFGKKPFIEILGGEKKFVSIIINEYELNIPKIKNNQKILNSSTNYLYIFENKQDNLNYNYDFCISKDLNNAIKKIELLNK